MMRVPEVSFNLKPILNDLQHNHLKLFVEEDNREKGKVYKPSSKLVDDKSATDKAQEYAKMLASDLKKDVLPLKKKNQEKKKSNLELFKEELRQ